MLESHRAAPLQGRATEGSTAGKLISELALNNMQHFIEYDVDAVLGAERHERTEERIGNRNSSLCRSITTKWLILSCRFLTIVLQFLLRRWGRLAAFAGLRRSSSTASPPINLAVRQLAGGPWAVIVAMGVNNAVRREVLGIKLSNREN